MNTRMMQDQKQKPLLKEKSKAKATTLPLTHTSRLIEAAAVPQGLKPSARHHRYAGLKACSTLGAPLFDSSTLCQMTAAPDASFQLTHNPRTWSAGHI